MPADASSPIPAALDQLREQLEPRPEEIPGLLERLAEALTCNVISQGLGMVADHSLIRVGAEQERNHFAGRW
ncbi:hypothetical protein HEP84_47085 [Streptomyces sp. RLB1-33]